MMTRRGDLLANGILLVDPQIPRKSHEHEHDDDNHGEDDGDGGDDMVMIW